MTRGLIVVAVAVVAGSVLVDGQAPAAGADPINGTWRRNLTKSTYSPGPPPAATSIDIRRFSTLEGGWGLFEQSGVDGQGDPVFQSAAFKTDGKPYPVLNAATLATLLTTGKPTNVTRSYRRIDASSVEFTGYNNGVAGNTSVRTVSKDGKTYTQTTKGKNPQGQAFSNVEVFDRVR